jgi:hypothetical protein
MSVYVSSLKEPGVQNAPSLNVTFPHISSPKKGWLFKVLFPVFSGKDKKTHSKTQRTVIFS